MSTYAFTCQRCKLGCDERFWYGSWIMCGKCKKKLDEIEASTRDSSQDKGRTLQTIKK